MSISLVDIVGPKGMGYIDHIRKHRPESVTARLADALEMAEEDLYDEKQKTANYRRKLEETEEILENVIGSTEVDCSAPTIIEEEFAKQSPKPNSCRYCAGSKFC